MAIELHQLLDEGRTVCGACRTLVPDGEFCGACGHQIREEHPALQCPTEDCRTLTTTRFCPRCGAQVLTEEAAAYRAGEATLDEVTAKAIERFYALQTGDGRGR